MKILAKTFSSYASIIFVTLLLAFGFAATPAFAVTDLTGTTPVGGTCSADTPPCESGSTCSSFTGTGTCLPNAPIQQKQPQTAAPVATPPAVTSPAPAPVVTNNNTANNSTGANPNDTPALTNPLQASSLTQLLQEVLAYVVQIGSIFLTLMLIFVGFQFVAARGNDEKLKSARSALLWTVIGGLLLLGAAALAAAISATVQAL